jgi:hypothetical protein
VTIDLRAYRVFLLVSGVGMIAWGLTYGYATYRLDQCNHIWTESLTAVNAGRKTLDADIARLDADVARRRANPKV